MIRFALGLRKNIVAMLPQTWYIANYRIKGQKVVVTRIARAYYEQVDNPGVDTVAFKTPKCDYVRRGLNTERVRDAIARAYTKKQHDEN